MVVVMVNWSPIITLGHNSLILAVLGGVLLLVGTGRPDIAGSSKDNTHSIILLTPKNSISLNHIDGTSAVSSTSLCETVHVKDQST